MKKMAEVTTDQKDQKDQKPSSEPAQCNDQFPQRWESPQGLADLGSAIGLAPQSPGLLGGLRDGTGVS